MEGYVRFFCLVADVQMLMPSIVSGGICEILLRCGFCADYYAIHPQRLAILMPPDMCGGDYCSIHAAFTLSFHGLLVPLPISMRRLTVS